MPFFVQIKSLTTSIDSFTGSTASDTFNATHLTFAASDTLVGGTGVDTLKIIDTGTAAYAPAAASASGIEIIKLQNLNAVPAVAAVTGVNEVAAMQFKALAAGQTVVVGGITFTAGTSGATAAQVAAAFADPLTAEAEVAADNLTMANANRFVVNGGELTGATFATNKTVAESAAIVDAVFTTNGYTPTISTTLSATTNFTATTNANVMDLIASGTAVTGKPQVSVLTVGITTSTTAVTFIANGQQVTTAVPGTTGASNYASAIADSINAFYGSTIATVSIGIVTVTSPTPISLSNFASTNMAVTSYALTGAYAAAAAPTITITPFTLTVSAVASASTGDTLTVTNFTGGATEFVSDVSTGAVTFSGDLAAGQTVTLNGNGVTTLGALTATFGAANTTPTFNITGGAVGTGNTNTINVGANTTTTNVTSTGAANTTGPLTIVGGRADGTLAIDATTNLTTGAVTADAKFLTAKGAATTVTLGSLSTSNLTSIDATGLSAGGLTMTLPSTVTSFKGGQSVDTITSATIPATAVIDAGAGTDVLILAANVTSAPIAAQYQNFETLRVVAGASQQVSLFAGITGVQVQSGTNSVTGLNATQAAKVTARASIGASTFALTDSTGTADVFTATLGAGTTNLTAASATGTLTLTGFETINLNAVNGPTSSTGSAARTSTIHSFNAIDANTINLTGTAFTLSDLANATGTRAKVLTVDGSALTGNGDTTNVGLTVSGNIFAGSTVIGSATADNNFTLGTQASVTYTGGAGKDTFTGTQSQFAADTITGGAGTTDTLVISSTGTSATIADTTFLKATGLERLTLSEVKSITFTSGTNFNTAFAGGTVLVSATAADASAVTAIDLSAYTGAATLTVTTLADSEATTLTTGSGNDVVTLTATAQTTGISTISTGAGNDTITAIHLTGGGTLATNTTFVINAGTGADSINVAAIADRAAALANVSFTIAGGDSTASAFDTITGFYAGAGGNPKSDILNFAGSAIKPADGFSATAVAGYTSAQLAVSASTAGLLTFTGTLAAGITEAQVIAAYTSTIDAKLNNLETVVWASATDTYVFNNNTTGDSVVKLVGLTGATAVGATDTTANLVGIA